MSIISVLITAVVVVGVPALYLAVRYREFRKFLAGAFFVSAGTQFYFWMINTPVPLAGTNIVQTPEVSLVRGVIHSILFLLCLYFGFIRKPG
jgi:hypothetical protein